MVKLLIGGSPCTHWSIAQTKNRETEPEGLGWELFKNYLIALEKFKPDFFLYENNKSMAPTIREQITRELGVEPILINSALVSAQNRQRLYWTNIPGVEQPEDKGILLRDILESGVCWREKGYTLRASIGQHGGTSSVLKTVMEPGKFSFNGAAEPARIGTIESNAKNADFDSQQYRVYSLDGKSVTLCGQGGGVGAKTGLYAVPTDCPALRVAEATAKGYTDILPGECVDLTMPYSKTRRGRTMREKANCLTSFPQYYQYCGTLDRPIYEVRDGQITIKGKQYPIKLADGVYIIRKLTVTECKRLQTVPEDYIFPVSDTQAYKMLGNGWTVDVIAHILQYAPGITEEPLEVLSMYDGMSCGHLALDKLGAHIAHYYATEIDKYAIKTTQHNFPDTIQLGDAFQVRDDGWSLLGLDGAITTPYAAFLRGKVVQAAETGFDADPAELSPALKPHQRAAVLWALKGGRVFCCHVKDRVLFGSATGMGMPTMEPFHALCIQHYMSAGFAYFGMITVVTDVVRENNQTYRLGWTEQCKDGSKMGVGCPEYILLFRKLPTDRSRAYADEPVVKSKEDYTRAQWQIDAHGFWRSSGDRLITKAELERMPADRLQAAYRKYSRNTVYSYEEHMSLAKKLDADGRLPATFMVVAPGSWTDQVWDDINRMRTLNTAQSQRRKQMHVCPLQLDIVDRLINRYSNPGELVLDPFGGLGTVALEAVKAGRRGYTIELNNDYFRDAVGYLKELEDRDETISLFDLIGEAAGK